MGSLEPHPTFRDFLQSIPVHPLISQWVCLVIKQKTNGNYSDAPAVEAYVYIDQQQPPTMLNILANFQSQNTMCDVELEVTWPVFFN